MKKWTWLFILVIYSLGCSNKKITEDSSIQTDTTTTESFFPVSSFLRGQMLQFDSILITPLHTITIKEKTDSEWIKKGLLKSLLQTFLFPEINDSNLTQYFKETKFNDQTINAITFTYSPLRALPYSIDLLMWNVYINPQTGKVTKIYLVKHLKENNRDIIQQLTWQTDRSAEITNILNNPNGKSEILKREKFIWNFDQ